ncbi:unnamed protein product [Adineta steineri]|uniref:Ubiquitin carboxyl-terminal hydrolase n=1 Tax=Adineta steineri TaxID=433720 RepID=A0A815W2C7_9BILA|nr:unnamed protein product [Adineta steineri]CAF1540369.1 unnamed protein product [Adineta steineri]
MSDNKPSSGRLRSNSYDQAMSSEHLTVNKPIVNNSSSEFDRKSCETIQRNNDDDDDDVYSIKWIEFNHQRLPILLQNMNGPCPLLAIANILLLRKRIFLPSNLNVISTEHVIATIAEYILQFDTTKLNDEKRINYERNIQDALAVLPKLKTGMDVNLKFNGVDKFEYTPECIIFDLLGIQLLHGWVVDPQDKELQKIIQSNALSYNQLIEKIIPQTDGNLSRESLLIQQFLEENRSQLTHYGILQLNTIMVDNQLAVLFRNNHFNTIWKNKNQLFLLVSDQGYLNHPSIVFETLTDIDNNSTFTNGYGDIWQKSVPVDTTRDRDLAIAMHKQQQRQYREEQLYQQQQQHSQRYYHEENSNKSRKKQRHPSYDDDQDCACILS